MPGEPYIQNSVTTCLLFFNCVDKNILNHQTLQIRDKASYLIRPNLKHVPFFSINYFSLQSLESLDSERNRITEV